MANIINNQNTLIQGMLDNFLKKESANTFQQQNGEHLDIDALSAFVEASLTENEAKPIIGHLVKCSFCRHISAELIKLDMAFAESEVPVLATEAMPASSNISDVFSNILSKIFGNSENSVFAHNEESENAEKDSESEKETKD